MRVLGISAFYHDSAAALLEDGVVVAAAQEERFSRKKHDARFPRHAIAYCLAEAGVTLDRVDHVAFYDKPFLKFERLLETYLAFAPRGFRSFRMAMPLWLPAEWNGTMAVDIRRALATGLITRPPTATIRDTQEWAAHLASGSERGAGIEPEREQELLRLWHQQSDSSA